MNINTMKGPGAAPVTSTPAPTQALPPAQPAPTPASTPAPAPAPKSAAPKGPTPTPTRPTRPQTQVPKQGKDPSNGNTEIGFDDMEIGDFSGSKVAPNNTTNEKVQTESGEVDKVSAEDGTQTDFSTPTEEVVEATSGDGGDPAVNTNKRDYTQFDPEVVEVARKLNNAMFSKYGPKLQAWKTAERENVGLKEQLKTLSAEKPRFLAEHADAYRIAPEFTQAKKAYQDSQEVQTFWSEQLYSIANAEAWREFQGYDNTGKAIIIDHPATEDGRVDKRSEIAVQQRLAQVGAQVAQNEANARNIAHEYSNYQKRAIVELNETSAKLFKGVTATNLNTSDKKFFDAALTMFPAQFKDHPLAPMVGLSFVQFRKLAVGYQKALAEIAQYKSGKTPPSAGPKNSTGGATTSGSMVDLDELYRYE